MKKNRLLRFFAQNTGSTLVEFTFAAPLFLLIVMTILEFGLVMVIRNFLQIGVTAGIRCVDMGQTVSTITSAVQNACMGGIMTSSSISVTVQSFSNCAAIGTSPTQIGSESTGSSGVGASGDMVLVRASYVYSPITPTVSAILGSSYSIYATSLTRND